jgi:hypothetical protein
MKVRLQAVLRTYHLIADAPSIDVLVGFNGFDSGIKVHCIVSSEIAR